MCRILVTGSKGQLGSELKALQENYKQFSFIFTDIEELDITNAQALEEFVVVNQVTAIVNCAAYTAVDAAEENQRIAFQLNAEAVEYLAQVATKHKLKIIHISTDYVFDGTASQPYEERSIVSPIGMYGKTKRAGETHILSCKAESLIIRTSWLYSSFGANFVKTMLRLGKEKEEVSVISDQVGTPTYARDLAKVILEILSIEGRIDEKGKIYHYSNEGVASWYDLAKAVMKIMGIKCEIKSIDTKDYPTKATRPHYSVLSKRKIKADFDIKIPYWMDSLEDCLQKLKELDK